MSLYDRYVIFWIFIHVIAAVPGLSSSFEPMDTKENSFRNKDSGVVSGWTSWHHFGSTLKQRHPQIARQPNPHNDSLFISANNTYLLAQLGSTAIFHCILRKDSVEKLQGPIMWSRDLPFALLAIDGEAHLEDPRIWVEKPDMNETEEDISDWLLAIRKVEKEDNGTYKCQTSDHPPKYILTHLFTIEAMALIEGPKEKFMKGGSRLRLVCHFHNLTESPETVFWYLNDHMINYDSRFMIDFIANGTILTIPSINSELAGNFTCAPLSITPDSVRVHIIDEEGAAVYVDSGDSLSPFTFSVFLASVFITNLYF